MEFSTQIARCFKGREREQIGSNKEANAIKGRRVCAFSENDGKG